MMPQPAQKYPESVGVLARPVIVILGLLLILLVSCQPIRPEEPAPAATLESPAAAGAITATVAVAEDSASTAEVVGTAAMTESATVTSSATITTSPPVTEAAAVPAADAPSGPPEASSPELIEAGMAVYRQQYCGVCHRLSAAGTQGTFGPPHDGMGKTAAARIADPSYTGSATTAAEYIMESLIDPSIYLVPGYVATPHRMPPYTHLDPASLDALVAMLLAQ